MTQDKMKQLACREAMKYIKPGSIIGVGTGSTVSHFINELKIIKSQINGVVSSSEFSTKKLQSIGVEVFDLNDLDELDIYVDGADEINDQMQMIKGGGGALTREKIIAAVAKKFICVVDSSKKVNILGKFPLPVEVIPMARSYVARELAKLGSQPQYRHGTLTDNGNIILDLHNLKIADALNLENKINSIVGVVTVGLFAHRKADIALIGSLEGVKTMQL